MPTPSPDLLEQVPEWLRPLAASGELKAFARGQELIVEGSLRDELYILLEGRLRAFSRNPAGQEITYGLYGAGELVGEMSLDGSPRSANVEAVEACACAMVTRYTLLAHIRSHPEFALELIAQLIRRVRAATSSARGQALESVYPRLVHLLGELAQPAGNGTRLIATPPTHRELGARLGCSRHMVTRLMKDLKSGGSLREDTTGWVLRWPLPPGW